MPQASLEAISRRLESIFSSDTDSEEESIQPSGFRSFNGDSEATTTSKRAHSSEEGEIALSKFRRNDLFGDSRSSCGDRRDRQRSPDISPSVASIYRNSLFEETIQVNNEKVSEYWESVGTGEQLNLLGISSIILKAMQLSGRQCLLQDIICERRCIDNPPTMERL